MGNMTREQAREKAIGYFDRAHIYLTEEEKENLEIADMGLDRLDEFGIVIHIYVNTKRCAAKEMVLFPNQICPEQIHPPFGDYEGKEESFRVRMGTLYLYTEGEPTKQVKAQIPEDKKDTFHVFHEIILNKGEQYTLQPNVTHWICGGPEGCVVSEFSSYNRDDYDIYTDPEIVRMHGVKPFED
ncbi:D-lyxose/D-mannose family sugar isomerase [Christensenella timonensis]|uniref:D-lyxose/D-mannose family sugar isomerase n=1 Tax=Christensenella timonensis TaxID=1816678 RepID=UPI00082A412B|nr:D-lyxose/D-mannose family sugar isomerase [Christensenella timonensis]